MTDTSSPSEIEQKKRSTAKKMDVSDKSESKREENLTGDDLTIKSTSSRSPKSRGDSDVESENVSDVQKKKNSESRLNIIENLENKIKLSSSFLDNKTEIKNRDRDERIIKLEKRFEKNRSSGHRSDDKINVNETDLNQDRESSPEIKDDISEHSESSKVTDEKVEERENLRIPFSGAPLGTGPGRGVPFGAPGGRSPHFPPPVFMWCPTIGLPPWCPALFPPGLVYAWFL